jgi:hypothetical protein
MAMAHISWNYATWLNILALLVSAVLVIRFWRTGGPMMLRTMAAAPRAEPAGHHHQAHRHGGA